MDGAATGEAAVAAAAEAVEHATAAASPLGWRLSVMALALLASFAFSASEFAVIRLDRLKLREEADDGSAAARTLGAFLSDTGRFLSSISVGNTLANLLLSSFAAVTFAPPLARWLAETLARSLWK